MKKPTLTTLELDSAKARAVAMLEAGETDATSFAKAWLKIEGMPTVRLAEVVAKAWRDAAGLTGDARLDSRYDMLEVWSRAERRKVATRFSEMPDAEFWRYCGMGKAA